MTPHGPDYDCFTSASNAELKPSKVAVGTQVKIIIIIIFLAQIFINFIL